MNVGFRIPTTVDSDPAARVSGPASDRTFDLREYLNFVWRNWIFIGLVTAFVFLVGVIYLVNATPLYTASTQVLLEPREKPPGLDAVANNGSINIYSYVDDQLAILRSDSLLRRVVIKERLVPPSTKELQAATQDKDDPASQEKAIVDAINRLRGALAVSSAGGARGYSNVAQHCHHLGRSNPSRPARQRELPMPMLSTNWTLVLSRPSGPRVG